MFKQGFKAHRATAVVSTHSCHGLVLACPSSEPSRAGREERTPTLQNGTATLALLSRPRVLAVVFCRDTLVPEQPDTYVNLTEDDINDAANHYKEVKDVPGVSKVALPGKSQRRGVTIQGLSQGEDRCRSLEEGVPEGSPVISSTSGTARRRMGVRPGTLWSIVWSCLAMV